MQGKTVRYFRPTLLYTYVISTQLHQPRARRGISFKFCMQCRDAGVLRRRAQGGCSHRSLPSDRGLCHALSASTACGGGLCGPLHSRTGRSSSSGLVRRWTLMSRQRWCCWNSRFCSKIKVHNFFCYTKEAVAIPCEMCRKMGENQHLPKCEG